MNQPILTVDGLHVAFHSQRGEVHAVRGVSFCLQKQETLAIVGESGSGKSVTAKAIMRLLPKQSTSIPAGQITYAGQNVLALPPRELQSLRGAEISMVFQDPMTSLNPTMTIGQQLVEGISKHQRLDKAAAYEKAVNMLQLVGIPNAQERIRAYPHHFSGGMRQRVGIAMALACDPKVLIADEPTTALDVTVQAQILELMKSLQQRTGTGIILITHDLGVVANMAQKVAVMYAGEVVETGPIAEIFYRPKHPYTWGLLRSMPRLDAAGNEPLIPIPGTPPDLARQQQGCPFAPRCAHVMKVCKHFSPPLTEVSSGHTAKCWLLDQRAQQQERLAGVAGG
ncbi:MULTISPECIES: ABC transporter ATP-binding protein [Brevibacillus]|jgi:oligopeptide/dipeptide ABC transporter, ATP-binding protein, C-terminal domain|uniref:ABC transporter ATP-binding protein n=1 Tax=Brevibacillus TaxID=55080 RepID=UPI000EF0F596|nr:MULTISPECIES: ABC transporter ATP-binding protein [Brevibacillus]MED2257417.1 ABC transporter ATP-binding protein [Brevibacillus parabrevis]NRQ52339.1 ABC transporter ATP-binding protein [Brevibacillus sp. HD1.4A]HBZ79537.1 peptide ABC transporter ATP-binding protein [Brevibacillus sp.]